MCSGCHPILTILESAWLKHPNITLLIRAYCVFLLGIEKPAQVVRDPLVGQLFENLVVIDCLKTCSNQGRLPGLYFFRDSNGVEVDVLIEQGRSLTALEVKSSSTYHASMFKNLKKISQLAPDLEGRYLMYSGEGFDFSDGINAVNFSAVDQVLKVQWPS